MSSVVEEVAKGLRGIRLTKEDEKQIMHAASCFPISMASRKELSFVVHQHVKKKENRHE